jgi:hypothetical protein
VIVKLKVRTLAGRRDRWSRMVDTTHSGRVSRFLRWRRQGLAFKSMAAITQRRTLVNLARSRVDAQFNIAPARVGEPSNGALLLHLARLVESSRS